MVKGLGDRSKGHGEFSITFLEHNLAPAQQVADGALRDVQYADEVTHLDAVTSDDQVGRELADEGVSASRVSDDVADITIEDDADQVEDLTSASFSMKGRIP